MLTGETVIVRTPSIGYDEHTEEVITWTEEHIQNVLVAPASTEDLEGIQRAYGVKLAFTLGFPKTFSHSLRGCEIIVRGITCRVIGDPQPNAIKNCPTAWWYTAHVEAVHG